MKKRLLQIDRLTNGVIHDWDSVERASKELGKEIIDIKAVANGKLNKNIKDIWLYPDNFKDKKTMLAEIVNRKNKIKKEIVKEFSKGKVTLQIDPVTKKVIDKWDNATAAAIYYKENPTSITDSARGERIITAGHIWIYEDDFSEEEIDKRVNRYKKSNCNFSKSKNPKLGKPLLQIDINTGYILKEWASVNDASFELDIINTRIRSVAREAKESKGTAGNYIWLYKDEFSSPEAVEKEIERRLTNLNLSPFIINKEGHGYHCLKDNFIKNKPVVRTARQEARLLTIKKTMKKLFKLKYKESK